MQDTQDLLQSLGELPEVDPALFDVEQILAEFGSAPPETEAAAPVQRPEQATVPPPAGEQAASPAEGIQKEPVPEGGRRSLLSEGTKKVPLSEGTKRVPVPEGAKKAPSAGGTKKAAASVAAKRSEKPPKAPPKTPPKVPPHEPSELESIVSSTVGAVLEEQNEARQEATRQMKRRQRDYRAKTRAEPEEAPEFQEEEPSLPAAAMRLKLRQRRLRRLASSALVFTAIHWALALLERYGVSIPLYSTLSTARLTVSLTLQVCVMVCATPVLVRAMEELRKGHVGWALLASLGALAAFVDTATASLLSDRCAGESLGGVAMVTTTMALWGAWLESAALRETLRVAALGRPAYVVDVSQNGAVKGSGGTRTFYNRTVSENDAAHWQQQLLPVVLAAMVVFALVSSFGQGKAQDFFWCFSVILTAGTALSLPVVYGLPFFRLAERLGRSGGAVAGAYGASQLDRCREMVLTDSDLFPPGCVRLKKTTIYEDDRQKVAVFAGSLAEELNACYTPLMRAFMQEERGRREVLVHFHIHEDGGASASIRGETAVLGSALTLRKQGVHLPRSIEQKEGLYLAIDGQLAAIFALEYTSREGVEWALDAMRRNGITPLLALRDGALNPKFLKQKFGSDGGAILLDAAAKSNLARAPYDSDPKPNGLLYREGLAPFFEVVAGGKRLTRLVRAGNLLSLLGTAAGTLLGYYLSFARAVTLLTPAMLLLFLLLWLVPVLVLGWGADKI